MASSSLLRLTRSLVPFRQALTKPLSAYPLTRHHSVNISQTRSFSSPSPPKFKLDMSFVWSQMNIAPSMLFTMFKDQQLTVTLPGLEKNETEEGLWVSFHIPETVGKKEWELGLEGFNFFFQLKTPETVYLATMKLPANYNPYGDWEGKTENGVCYVCIPTQKTIDPSMAKANITRDLTRPTRYCEMFHRSGRLCEVIAHPGVKSKSFTAYKKDDGESIYFEGNLPGVEKLVVTSEGLCVSLNMPGFEIEEVEVGFEYDTMIIEGKREGEHYIAGVRVPDGFHREGHLIRREMQDGVFKATLPHVDVNKRVFSVYR